MKRPLTIMEYAALIDRDRGLVGRWLASAEPSARLPGGGVVVIDPSNPRRRWIEVDDSPRKEDLDEA